MFVQFECVWAVLKGMELDEVQLCQPMADQIPHCTTMSRYPFGLLGKEFYINIISLTQKYDIKIQKYIVNPKYNTITAIIIAIYGEFLFEWCEYFGQPRVWYIHNWCTTATVAVVHQLCCIAWAFDLRCKSVTYTDKYMHIYIHTYTYIYICTETCIHAYIYIHTVHMSSIEPKPVSDFLIRKQIIWSHYTLGIISETSYC